MARLEYENARLRSLKRELLDPGFYERLFEVRSPEELANILSETCYGADVSAAMLTAPGYRGIELGLKNNLANCYARITHFFSEENRYLAETLLGRYDIWNVKAVLRGKHIGVSAEEIYEAVMPAGELSEALITRLINAVDVREVINLLTVWGFSFARVLRDAYPDYHSSGKLLPLELALDRNFYSHCIKTLGERKNDIDALLLLEFIRQEIDFINIMTAIRLAAESFSEEEASKYFIEGGRKFLKKHFNESLRSPEPEKMLAVLQGTPYAKAAEEGIKRYLKTGYVSSFQRALEEFLTRQAAKLFLADPLSSAMLIAYFYTKHNEVTNLRIIVRGKSVEMSEDEIREAMIIV
jgi:V/A-type H+-transporting ATPase subunit C